MASNNTKASTLQKFDKSYTRYVRIYHTFDYKNRVIQFTSEMFTVTMEGKYKLRLELSTNYVRLYRIDALTDLPIRIITSKAKDWKVYFTYFNVNGTALEKHAAHLVGDHWESMEKNPIQYDRLHSYTVVIQCKIEFNENAINNDSRIINFTLPKFEALDDVIVRLFEEQKFTDVTINVCGKELRAHKVILAARSSVFSAMFENKMSEQIQNKVDITDMDFEVIREMLRFIYTGKAINIAENTSEFLAAADKYDLQMLKAMCEEEMAKSIAVENAAEILKVADLYNAEFLKAVAIDFITWNTKDVIETAGYQSMIPTHPHLVLEMLRLFVINFIK